MIKTSFYQYWKEAKKRSSKHEAYFDIYQDHFNDLINNKDIKILEIGVSTGGSLEAISNYFKNKALVVGLERNESAANLNFNDNNIKIIIGNAEDHITFKKLKKEFGLFDLIIDDGGHTNLQQLSALVNGIDLLKKGGKIIIEDTQCSYLRKFGNPSNYSMVSISKKLIDRINYRSNQINGKFTNFPIYKIEFSCGMITFTKSRNSKLVSKQVLNSKKNILGPADYRFVDKPFLQKYTSISSFIYKNLNKYIPKSFLFIPKKIFGYFNNIFYQIILDKNKFNKLLRELDL